MASAATLYSDGLDASAQEEKEVLDYFAGVFTVLDVRNFSLVFKLIGFLHERPREQCDVDDPAFPRQPNVSRYFADILLTFLVGRIDQLGNTDDPASAVLLRLFKLVFGSITLFPENEPVLRPHLATIVQAVMQHTTSASPSSTTSTCSARCSRASAAASSSSCVGILRSSPPSSTASSEPTPPPRRRRPTSPRSASCSSSSASRCPRGSRRCSPTSTC